MKEYSISKICRLFLIGSGLSWGSLADESLAAKRNIRRRARYIPKILDGDRRGRASKISRDSFLNDDEDRLFRGISFSMPDYPTVSPAEPPTKKNRDLLIENKCGVTAIERSRDILTELLTVSDSSTLINPETSQFKAREWLDNVDPALICPQNRKRIDQRYRLALLYFELGGSSWTRCKADQDVTDSDVKDDCPGARFLDKANECEWGGMDCGDSYNHVKSDWLDSYYPLEVLDLQSNNLVGSLFVEFYGFLNLKEIFLNNNSLSGTIDEEIGNFEGITVLRLDSNMFDGDIPEDGLLAMEKLAGLSIHGNDLRGSLEALCDAKDSRQIQYQSYLALMMEADCLGEPPEVSCSCCTCF